MMKVLIVEDHRETRQSLDVILSSHQCWVKTAYDANQAKRILLLGLPDAVVADYYLPGDTGLSLLKYLRGLPGGEKVFFILVTGAGEARISEIKECVDGMENVAFLSKPFEADDLIEILFPRESVTGETDESATRDGFVGRSVLGSDVDHAGDGQGEGREGPGRADDQVGR